MIDYIKLQAHPNNIIVNNIELLGLYIDIDSISINDFVTKRANERKLLLKTYILHSAPFEKKIFIYEI